MTTRVLHRFTILVSAMATASLGALLAGCAAPPLSAPSPETSAERKTVFQAWNPIVASAPGGRLYVSFFGRRQGEKPGLFVTRSLDRGQTWSPEPVQLDSLEDPKTRFGFHRLDSAGEGAVAVSWSIEIPEAQFWKVKEVRHVRSSDSGASWSTTPIIRKLEYGSNFPTPLAGSDGSLFLFWTQKGERGTDLQFLRTATGGASWLGKPVPVPGPPREVPAEQKSTNPRLSPGYEMAWPSVASDGLERLYVIWQEAFVTGTNIFFNRSLDGGTTWLTRAPRLDSPPSSFNNSRFPAIALDTRGGIYAFWEDLRNDGSDIYFNRSLDGGTTWLNEDVRLTPTRGLGMDAISPAVAADQSGHLYMAWLEGQSGSLAIYFNRSLDKGRTWLPRPIRLDHHGKDIFSYAVKLRSDEDGHVYVVWWEREKDRKDTVRFNRSLDQGTTWLEKDLRLDSDGPGKGKEGARFPGIASDGTGSVYVTWSGDQQGTFDLFLNRSTDHGLTWLPKEVQVTR
jgi:hypothetical protein